ncbi:hypothetical protein [Streptomyces sp. NPDC059008]|uniref:hypothetical protein n=1 Tax=unclassified Streptomyces TaxID=2593676 RepID=UPI00367AEAC0
MRCVQARRAAFVPAAGLVLALAPPAAADGPVAPVRVAVTGGAFTGSVGIVRTAARSLYGGFPCAADGVHPTPLTALADADRRYRLGVRAHWDEAAGDFVVTEIRGDVADGGRKWNAYVNEKKITTGPCGTAVKDHDKVRWTLEAATS